MPNKLKIKDFPEEERPRERLIRNGAKALSNSELLAIILRLGGKNENVLDLAKRLLNKYSLDKLSRININTLKKIEGIGESKACQIVASFELGRRISSLRKPREPVINNPKDVAKLLAHELMGLNQEHFLVLFLNTRKKLIKKEILFIGTLDTTVIHPREVFRKAFAEGAAALILAHNHPSGDPKPSKQDLEITQQLINAGKIMGIEVLDHVIVGDRKWFSLVEKKVKRI